MEKWHRLTPKKIEDGLTVIIGQFNEDELNDMKSYGYRVDEVVVLTVKEYEKLKRGK